MANMTAAEYKNQFSPQYFKAMFMINHMPDADTKAFVMQALKCYRENIRANVSEKISFEK